MRKRIVIAAVAALFISLGAQAQRITTEDGITTADASQTAFVKAQEAFLNYNTEKLDSIDQERLPRKVTLGLLANTNVSNFIIKQEGDSSSMSSHMKVGWDIGGFIDFSVTQHFAIQGQAVFTAEQNRFGVDNQQDRMWSFGVNLPVYFLGRFGNQDDGYVSFGAGPYTHVTFASNIKGHYANNGAALLNLPAEGEQDQYAELYKLHRFHSGLAATVIYEFKFGMQIFASYMVSLTDIFSFYAQYDGTPEANASIYPQRVSLGVGYRFKQKTQVKHKVKEGKDHL